MVKKFSILVTLAILFAGCEKIEIDPDYPTIYKRIPSSTLEQMRIEFAQNNVYLKSSLSDFGFCSRFDYDVSPNIPPVLDTLTENEAIELIRAFVSLNPSATGVKNMNDFQIERIWSSSGGHHYGTISWLAISSNQMVDTIEVVDSKIYLNITNRELVSITNNWFPDIYIPENFVFNQDWAKSKLIGKTVSHSIITGDIFYQTISEEDTNSSVIKLVITPVAIDERIELRVTWQIWIVSYKIYVDVMTGEIVREEATYDS